MARPLFVSYVTEDKNWLSQLRDWSRQRLLGDFEIDAFDEKLHPTLDSEIKNQIKERIRKAAAVIVLVGDNTHNHDWIPIEVEIANSFPSPRPVLAVRIPNTSGGLPKILGDKKLLDFKPEIIEGVLKTA